jgi:hypothetical protein
MRRFRLRTLLIVIAIVALILASFDQKRRSARREAQLQAELQLSRHEVLKMRAQMRLQEAILARERRLRQKLEKSAQPVDESPLERPHGK